MRFAEDTCETYACISKRGHDFCFECSAIIMETGGYCSHGAIVTREYGIPAVVNIPGIMKMLDNGGEVIVDGDEAGHISLILEAKEGTEQFQPKAVGNNDIFHEDGMIILLTGRYKFSILFPCFTCCRL